jgi:hypothetical protein
MDKQRISDLIHYGFDLNTVEFQPNSTKRANEILRKLIILYPNYSFIFVSFYNQERLIELNYNNNPLEYVIVAKTEYRYHYYLDFRNRNSKTIDIFPYQFISIETTNNVIIYI